MQDLAPLRSFLKATYPGVTVDLRNGKPRFRYRSKGVSTRIPFALDDPEFALSYRLLADGQSIDALKEQRRPSLAPQRKTQDRTLDAAFVLWRQSEHCASIKPRNRTPKINRIERVLDFRLQGHRLGSVRVEDIRSSHVREVMGGWSSRGVGNSMRAEIKLLLDIALERGWVEQNWAAVTPKLKTPRSKARTAWTDEDIRAYLDRWGPGTQARLVLLIYRDTGARSIDVWGLRRSQVASGRFYLTSTKTENTGLKILSPDTLEELSLHPHHISDSLWVSAAGAPRTLRGFQKWFRDRCTMAGLEGLGSHGMRHWKGAKLAEAGASIATVAAVLGHEDVNSSRTYIQAASRDRMVEDAIRSGASSGPLAS